MKKRNILVIVLLISMLSASYFFNQIITASGNFKNDFKEFEMSSEYKIILNEGTYDLFELSSKENSEKIADFNYRITKQDYPKIITIERDTTNTPPKSTTTFTYTIYQKKYKSIGQFKNNKRQEVTIISKINNTLVEKLAFRQKENSESFFSILKFSILFLFSLGFLITAIVVLATRK
ncbi:MAG: hypothetical protein HKP59_09600 [Lutibacter sp.]|uniref:hypothetical protein n=1 Tax=Lutibacter sp. TaxID=1925666 RepID=UPI001792360A|nr:hypothetical protein [Lutibacter sp.]MBT8317873.1 hypothetical protein [Lutibacter sp.]NNJ58731.1 hypothetical protein [Lutibacter sp.]